MAKLASINTFIPSDNRKALISIKVYGYSVCVFFSTTMLLLSCFERRPHFICYLHSKTVLLTPKFPGKTIVYPTI